MTYEELFNEYSDIFDEKDKLMKEILEGISVDHMVPFINSQGRIGYLINIYAGYTLKFITNRFKDLGYLVLPEHQVTITTKLDVPKQKLVFLRTLTDATSVSKSIRVEFYIDKLETDALSDLFLKYIKYVVDRYVNKYISSSISKIESNYHQDLLDFDNSAVIEVKGSYLDKLKSPPDQYDIFKLPTGEYVPIFNLFYQGRINNKIKSFPITFHWDDQFTLTLDKLENCGIHVEIRPKYPTIDSNLISFTDYNIVSHGYLNLHDYLISYFIQTYSDSDIMKFATEIFKYGVTFKWNIEGVHFTETLHRNNDLINLWLRYNKDNRIKDLLPIGTLSDDELNKLNVKRDHETGVCRVCGTFTDYAWSDERYYICSYHCLKTANSINNNSMLSSDDTK